MSQEQFLGLEWRRVELERREPLAGILSRHPQCLSGFTFATLYGWDPIFDYRWALTGEDGVLLSCVVQPDPNRHLIQPVGNLDEAVVKRMVADFARLPYPLRVFGCTEAFLASHPRLSERFHVAEEPIAANYVYAASDLADLPGKRFSPKRNLIAQATRLHPWTSEPLQAAHVPDCRRVVAEAALEGEELTLTARQELVALKRSLDAFESLGLHGVLVRVEGTAAAFAMWEPMAPKTAVIHYERALRRFKGLYQVVNREAARLIRAEGFTEINREEDLGNPGLRQAKLSYNPIRLDKSFTLTWRG